MDDINDILIKIETRIKEIDMIISELPDMINPLLSKAEG